jgi:hypothetical protein
MDERWRGKPGQVIAIEPHPYEVVQMPDGRLLRGVDIIMTLEKVERIRLGRECLNCFEPQEVAFPERCSLCGFPMKEEQLRIFEQEFAGETHVGSRHSLADERARLREEGI